MHKIFPYSEVKNVKAFYLLSIFTNGWFINANWIFLALTFMTKAQLGLMDGVSLAIGNFVDLPSGAIADLIGRKKIIIFARFLFALGTLLFVFSYDVWSFTIANIFFCVGLSFYGGADQALLFDSLKDAGKEQAYLKIASQTSLLQRVTTFIASLTGAALFAINIRYPFVFLFFFAVISFVISLFLQEAAIQEKKTFSFTAFIKQQVVGFHELLKGKLLTYAPIFLVILGIQFIYDWGILRGLLAIQLGFSGSELTVLFGTLSFFVGLVGILLPKFIEKSSDYKMSLIFGVLLCMGLFFAHMLIPNKLIGVVMLTMISVPGGLLSVLSQKIVNDEAPSHMRATILSALSLTIKIPYILLGFLIGLMAQNGQLSLLMLCLFGCGIIAILTSILLKVRHYEKAQ